MREFERITVDYHKLGGLPHFRDTNITVSEVVRLVMDGTANADILAQYPDLEPEALQEALAYAMQDVLGQIARGRTAVGHSIVVVHGYNTLLAKDLDELSDFSIEEKRVFADYILANTDRIARAWHYLSDSTHLFYGQHSGYWDGPKSLPDIVNAIESFIE